MFRIVHRSCWAHAEPSSWVSRPKLAHTFRTASDVGGLMPSGLGPERLVAAGSSLT